MFLRIFCFGVLLLALRANPSLANAKIQTSRQQGLRFFLNQHGFRLLSAHIKETLLKPVVEFPLPDLEETMDYGINVKASGLKLSLEFTRFYLKPAKRQLLAQLAMRGIKLHVGEIVASKEIIAKLTATCRHTTLFLGENQHLLLSARAPVFLQDEKLQVRLADTHLDLSEDNFRVEGPASCTGPLGSGRLIKAIVRSVLAKSHEKIRTAIEQRFAATAPFLGETLNQFVVQEIPFKIGGPFSNKPLAGAVLTFPSALQLSAHGADFQLGLTWLTNSSRTPKIPTQQQDPQQHPSLVTLGAVGLNPLVLADFWEEAVAKQMPEIEITPDLFSGAERLLQRDSLASIWPDLQEASEIEGSTLRIFMGIPEKPQIQFAEDHLAVALPQITLRLQVRKAGAWTNYFHVALSLAGQAKLNMQGNRLDFGLGEKLAFTVSGRWDSAYRPRDAFFDQETFETVFAGLLGLLNTGKPLYGVELPTFAIGGSQLGFAGPFLREPFIEVDVNCPRYSK